MKNILNYIEKLENTNSRLEKEKILEEAFLSNCFELFEGFKLAYDSLITFGVKKIPQILEFEDDENSFLFEDFKKLANKLEKRELTGHAARDALIEAVNKSNPNLWNKFYRRILLKDLRCGVTETTINKVLKKLSKNNKNAKKYIIETFELQLATSIEDLSDINGLKYLDQKFDGVRIVAILNKENNSISIYTRNGKLNHNFTEIENSLQKVLENIDFSIVLDGEIISRSFQELMKQLNRKEKIDTKDAKFAVFDIIPYEDFKNKKSNIKLRNRHEMLVALEPMFQEFCKVTTKNKTEIRNVFVIPKLEVNLDSEEGKKSFNEFNLQTLEAGYEGIMVKDPECFYEFKRNKNWIKIKPTIEVTLKVVEVEEGTGRNQGRLGNFICEGEDLGYFIKVSVGSGFTDQQRTDFWKNKEKLIGELIEIQADMISKDSSEKEHYSLRFPRFKCFRTLDGESKI